MASSTNPSQSGSSLHYLLKPICVKMKAYELSQIMKGICFYMCISSCNNPWSAKKADDKITSAKFKKN